MSSRYTVIQYLPQPLSDERINIGVIAWDEHGMSSQFAKNWHRVQAFGNEDIKYLREFAAKIEHATAEGKELPLFQPWEKFDPSAIEKMAETWHHSIRLTPVRGSLKDRSSLLADIAPIYLTHAGQERVVPRSRRTAAKIAAQKVTAVVAQKNPFTVEKMVKTNWTLAGRYDTHEFPVVVTDASPFVAVEAVSFEVQESKIFEWELRSVLWACEDVQQKNSKIHLAVFAIEPHHKSILFDRTANVLRKLKIPLVTEANVDRWASRQIPSAAVHASR